MNELERAESNKARALEKAKQRKALYLKLFNLNTPAAASALGALKHLK